MSSSNYPPGVSDSTWDAPWNEYSVPEKEFDVVCSQTLSKSVTVWTDNYVPGASGCDYEDGVAIGWQDPDDTSDTNWAEEYHDNDHYTPIQLIKLFKERCELELKSLDSSNTFELTPSFYKKKKRELKHLIEECDGWCEDDVEFIKD